MFPTTWKGANIIPVFKKGSKKLPYRPVSSLALSSEILEKVVCEGLFHACLPALSPSQHGFLPKRSCVTNLVCLFVFYHRWSLLTQGSQTDAIYTDYSSAFTSVSHRLLLYKLEHSFNISGHALGWIESYLSQRYQRVIIDGKRSDWTPILSRVPE